ncbi:hypothetical protein [Halogeometricum pallidum]|uniref:hypothetical protein n=1 Tax=Halogeometricum pallidum TaxID=411361 RepID=UPI001268307C|nr:hypothetical protein [Halogeometricum pallidum]
MIEPIPHRWRSVRATVGDTVKIPIDADSVSLLPAEYDSDEVTVSFFVSDVTGEFDTEPEMESRPIEVETIGKGETSLNAFCYHPTIVPAPDGESARVYFLGQLQRNNSRCGDVFRPIQRFRQTDPIGNAPQ